MLDIIGLCPVSELLSLFPVRLASLHLAHFFDIQMILKSWMDLFIKNYFLKKSNDIRKGRRVYVFCLPRLCNLALLAMRLASFHIVHALIFK